MFKSFCSIAFFLFLMFFEAVFIILWTIKLNFHFITYKKSYIGDESINQPRTLAFPFGHIMFFCSIQVCN
jgi:hypothetical protein